MLVTNGYPGELQMTDVAGTIRHGGLTSGYGNIGGPGAVYKHSVQVTGYTRVSAQEEGMRATMYLPCVSLFKFFKTNTRGILFFECGIMSSLFVYPLYLC